MESFWLVLVEVILTYLCKRYFRLNDSKESFQKGNLWFRHKKLGLAWAMYVRLWILLSMKKENRWKKSYKVWMSKKVNIDIDLPLPLPSLTLWKYVKPIGVMRHSIGGRNIKTLLLCKSSKSLICCVGSIVFFLVFGVRCEVFYADACWGKPEPIIGVSGAAGGWLVRG